ncbi:DUF4236 domain-containing protein [Thalassobacillus sp. CUG 92003]|uniref:DUF4236 domain-containing protein n=1 Tax=Thalassobacillus sp. CUG 92003 TaxID=2736641 RepID=UPI0015E68A43|nr:DUF4236 domain-containing protein [Thalassobacillus sp. CUG 92003]
MGMRFRKSFKVAPGVRMNVGKKGVGTTIGGKGLRVNTSSRGVSVGSSVPGTGVSYNKQISSRTKRPQRTNYERLQQQKAKEEKLEQAKQDVEKYEAHIDMLTSVHEEVNDPIYWEDIRDSSPPFEIDNEGPNVLEARDKLKNYQPTWRDKLFNRTEARKEILSENIQHAKNDDDDLYREWENDVAQSNSVLDGDRTIWNKVVDTSNPFEDIEELGSHIKYSFSPTDPSVKVELNIRNKEVVPEKTLSLTKTGKLSQRNMAKGKYFQLYQDYVCSCTLRIAREFFTLLPLNETVIHVYDDAPADEAAEYGCILSVRINREEIEKTHFTNIDCSDTIETFEHNMKFLKTKGFKFVEEVK